MATERLSMRAIREIRRQRWVLGQSHRAVALSTGRSIGAVYETLTRAREAGLGRSHERQSTDQRLVANVGAVIERGEEVLEGSRGRRQ